jgi:hypothetical protein
MLPYAEQCALIYEQGAHATISVDDGSSFQFHHSCLGFPVLWSLPDLWVTAVYVVVDLGRGL